MQNSYLEKCKQTSFKNDQSDWLDHKNVFENEDLFDNDQVYLYYLRKWAAQNPDLTFSFIVPKGIPKKYSPFTSIKK